MKKFQELLMKDLGWKLLSVAIATVLWFMVINIDQPIATRSYSRPLAIENLEALSDRGLTVGNMEELKDTKITVKVKAQRTALDRLSLNPEWIQASVDLSDLAYAVNGDTVALPVDISIQNSATYGISSKSPSVVEVDIETLATKELPIEVQLNGSLGSDVILSHPTLSSETAVVSGPASAVNKVVKVSALVNAEDLEHTSDVRSELLCYDAKGQIVKGVSVTPQEVVISYAHHDAKQVPIHIDITGTPADGYRVGDTICTPKYAEVTGSPEDLENLLYLYLGSIDVSGRSADVTKTFSLADVLPEGISLQTEENDTVEVTVKLSAQSNKQLTLPASKLHLQGEEDDKTYTIRTDARITITGDDLQNIQADDLKGTLYVNGLSEGDHRVLVHVDLPNGCIMDPAYVTVTVTDAAASGNE